MDANGHLLGIVAMDDLIPVLAEELSALAQAIRVEQRREAHRRPWQNEGTRSLRRQ